MFIGCPNLFSNNTCAGTPGPNRDVYGLLIAAIVACVIAVILHV